MDEVSSTTRELGGSMFVRLYVAGLTLTFLLCTVVTKNIGMLEGTVMVSAVLYLILDIREELSDLRQLEARVSSLS